MFDCSSRRRSRLRAHFERFSTTGGRHDLRSHEGAPRYCWSGAAACDTAPTPVLAGLRRPDFVSPDRTAWSRRRGARRRDFKRQGAPLFTIDADLQQADVSGRWKPCQTRARRSAPPALLRTAAARNVRQIRRQIAHAEGRAARRRRGWPAQHGESVAGSVADLPPAGRDGAGRPSGVGSATRQHQGPLSRKAFYPSRARRPGQTLATVALMRSRTRDFPCVAFSAGIYSQEEYPSSSSWSRRAPITESLRVGQPVSVNVPSLQPSAR